MTEPLASIRAERGHGDTVTVTVSGEVDASNAEEVQRACAGHIRGAAAAVLDLGAVRYLDSAGLRILVILLQDARAAGTRLRVSVPRDGFVAELLELTGLDVHLAPPDHST
ncbi:MAG: STAS domain-containing protein [Thermoleophilia bacterium]|nr:STAS domain-containing protein [Thermoleophilia bacterium]